ncbi:cytochrome P450 [Cyathus striatus]|nr:cytochrome P450 [Cyathus striatus]
MCSATLVGDITSLQICFTIVVPISAYLFFTSESWKLRHIPTAGFSGWPVLSYISAIQFILNSDKVLQKYHNLYKGKPFKIASPNEWVIVFHDGIEDVKETMKLLPSVSSSSEYLYKSFQMKYSFGEIGLNHQHMLALVKHLNHEIANNVQELRGETEATMKDILAIDDDWKGYDLEVICQRIVGRVTTRMMVGEELCRNPTFLRTCIQVIEKASGIVTINALIPPVLWPLTPYIMKGTQRSIDDIREMIEPIITRSPYWDESNGNLQKSPAPLDWMVVLAKDYKDQYTVDSIARRIAQLSFVSLSTTSVVFRITLYNLISHPEYIPILKEEVENVTTEDGWNKLSLDKMEKLESFILESHRTTPFVHLLAMRVMMEGHTFRDGTYVPRGTVTAHWTDPTNIDNETFENAQQFNGLRFYNLCQNGQNTRLTSISPFFILFGTGREACPGRFFASLELKILLAYMLLNFDIKAPLQKGDTSGLKHTIFDKSPARGQILLRKKNKLGDLGPTF